MHANVYEFRKKKLYFSMLPNKFSVINESSAAKTSEIVYEFL